MSEHGWHGDGDACTGIHCGNPEHGWTSQADSLLREALRAYIDHDLGGVHIHPGQEAADYEACETLHYRYGALAYPEKAAEYAALAQGADR